MLFLAALPARWTSGIRSTVTLTIAITVSAVGRALIHLYQGTWPAAAALCWGAAAVYLYYRYRVLLALIAVHTLWNLAVLTQYSAAGANRFVLVTLAVLAGAAIITLTWQGLNPPAAHWTPHEPAPDRETEYSKTISTGYRTP
ncbi:CPBP family intramembrane glutamic endopeptidase [Nocardia carnea]|uniref:CPBP family intramembrane glutamic endopeptidase n=1 Tax=Nocardia carnea TaxID=37328 RepID=UPI002454CE09|nr:CPBP family intramembrane metalloprotease [Nocardia carnea]